MTDSNTAKPTIVAIDDSASALSLYKMAIADLALEFITFESAEDALPYLKTHQPDLLLIDIIMPNIDGLTFLQKLRDQTLHHTTAVIVLSTKDYMQDKRIAENLGALEFVVKPVRASYIRDLVLKYLKSKRNSNDTN